MTLTCDNEFEVLNFDEMLSIDGGGALVVGAGVASGILTAVSGL